MTRALVLVALLLAGCTRGGDALPAPDYGTAPCAGCAAVIAAPRHAAQYQRADGSLQSFDDPACLFRALRAEPQAARAIRFHGPGEDEWIAADDAWFAKVPGQTTPHGDGWAAVASFAAAQDAVAQAGSGEILPFDQARQRVGQ
jgi:hypothetical protein